MITGSIVAIVTPMHEDGSLDLHSLRKLVDFHAREGTDAIVIVGTTGESPTVDCAEHIEIIKLSVKFAAGKIKVIAGTGANATSEAIELTKAAEKIGVTGSLQVCPYYNKPSQEGLYQHFKTIARETSLPIMLYNIPGRCGVAIAPETVERLEP